MSTADSNQQAITMAVDKDDLLSPVELIESIRRYEFGIGADLQGDGQEVVDRLVRKYTNLLETVAKDLNSKESHFLLELVQNADDNHYAEGTAPALTFRLKSNELVVSNNEQGFAPKNVRALCSAGESSKKNKVGYIGEKGIGFKSVFKVTDTPEIHSNGFHFRFDLSNPEEKLGYVVPHWVPPRDDAPDGLTTVVLPAKAGYTFLPSLLDDLSATLLLFLGKLRRLEVHAEEGSICYERSDDGALSTLTVASVTPGADASMSSTGCLPHGRREAPSGYLHRTQHLTSPAAAVRPVQQLLTPTRGQGSSMTSTMTDVIEAVQSFLAQGYDREYRVNNGDLIDLETGLSVEPAFFALNRERCESAGDHQC